jgi:hypothetical protein
MKIFFQNGIPGYGARFYICYSDRNTKVEKILHLLCAWGNSDKENSKENWLSFEMVPIENDYLIYKTLIQTHCHNVQIFESLEGWEEFLTYCEENIN